MLTELDEKAVHMLHPVLKKSLAIKAREAELFYVAQYNFYDMRYDEDQGEDLNKIIIKFITKQ